MIWMARGSCLYTRLDMEWNGMQTVEDGHVHQEYGWMVWISGLGLIGHAWMNELMD